MNLPQTYKPLCVWKQMAYNEKSSTFQDVGNNSNHPLYRCKAFCNGYGDVIAEKEVCRFYKALIYRK